MASSLPQTATNNTRLEHHRLPESIYERPVEPERRLLGLGEGAQAVGNVEEGAAIVIGSLPVVPFVQNRGLAVGSDVPVQAMKFRVSLVVLDETPLLLEGFEIQV